MEYYIVSGNKLKELKGHIRAARLIVEDKCEADCRDMMSTSLLAAQEICGLEFTGLEEIMLKLMREKTEPAGE